MKKFFALLTALVLCVTLFVGTAMAEDENLASAFGFLVQEQEPRQADPDG